MAKKKKSDDVIELRFKPELVRRTEYITAWSAELQEHDDWYTQKPEEIRALADKVMSMFFLFAEQHGAFIQGFTFHIQEPITVYYTYTHNLGAVEKPVREELVLSIKEEEPDDS